MKSKVFKKVAAVITAMTMVGGFAEFPPFYTTSNYGLIAYADEYGSIVDEGSSFARDGSEYWWKLNNNGVLYVGGTARIGEGGLSNNLYQSDYESSISPWYDYYGTITKVVIEEGVTEIGNWAFSGLLMLKEASLPSTLISIGTRAFYNDTRLTKINICESTTNIMSDAFGNCSKCNLVYYSKPISETDLLEKVKEKSGKDIYKYLYVDLDHDGNKEMIAAVFNPSDRVYDIWYCSHDFSECKIVWTSVKNRSDDFCNLIKVDYTERTHVIVNVGNQSMHSQWSVIIGSISNGVKDVLNNDGTFYYDNNKNVIVNEAMGYDESGFGVDIERYYVYDTQTEHYVEYQQNEYAVISSATMTQYDKPLEINDELLFNVVIRDADGNPINVSDLENELSYTTTVSNDNCIRVDSQSTDLTGAFIKATAIGEGTATLTVTFDNGVTASSTVTIKKSGGSDDATDTTDDSRYGDLVLDFAPANLTFEYSEENGEITPASSDCSAGLAYGKIAIDKELFLEVNKVTIKAPKGFGFNESRSQESLTQTCVTPESIYTIGDENPSFDFTLYAPTKEFLDGNVVDKTYYPNLTITVYGDNGFVKTFEESFTVKYKPANSDPGEDIPENAIIIDEDVRRLCCNSQLKWCKLQG